MTKCICKRCKKVIGKLDVDGKAIFSSLLDGVVESNGLYCCESCYLKDTFKEWLNQWGAYERHKCLCEVTGHVTRYGKGYRQAMKDVYDRVSSSDTDSTIGKIGN